MPEQSGVKEIDFTILILKIIEKNIWAGVLCFGLFFGYKIFIKHLEIKEKKILSLEEFEEEKIKPLEKDVKELQEEIVKLKLLDK